MKLSLVFISSLLALLLALTGAAEAAQRTTLYDFGGGLPGALTLAQDGSIYGALSVNGEIYRLSPSPAGWHKDVLYRLSDDGNYVGPVMALSIRDDGSLLVALQGLLGAGHGEIILLTPSGGAWSKSVVHSFQGSDGEWPAAGLTQDGQGNLLGFTTRGGSADGGTLYRLVPSASANNWPVQTVIDFVWSNGALPTSNLVPNGHGGFYATLAGSKDIVSLIPPAAGQTSWSQTVLHHYPAPLWEFRWPLAVDKNGAIYGNTANKIFRLIPPTAKQKKWKSVILMSFSKKNSVQTGLGLSGVIVDAYGTLFGLTTQGGSSPACGKSGCGTLFKLTPPALGQTKYTFSVIDQQAGGGGLFADGNGALYGTTAGSVFMVTGSGFQP
jgi:hypothetical protein